MTQRPALTLSLFAIFASILFAFMFDINHVIYLAGSLGDQLNYVNVSRNLVNYGHFIIHGQFEGSGNIIIPGLLTSEGTRLYFPGFYLILAGFFKLFGYSPAKAILPNIMMYISGTLLTFFIGKKLYSEKIGFWSAVIFFLLPLNTFTAFTCMGDIALPFMALLMFALFLMTPQKYRALCIPFMVGAVFIFRQTGLFFLIPLLGYYADQNQKNHWWHFVLLIASTIILCHLLSVWQTHAGQAKVHFLDVLSTGHLDYTNAFPEVKHLNSLAFFDIVKLITNHTIDNFRDFFSSFHGIKPDINFLAEVSFISMFIMFLIASFYSIKQIKKEYFAASCCLFLLAVAAADMVYYIGMVRTLLRMSMISFPFVIIQAVRFLPTKRALLFSIFFIISSYAIIVGSHKLRHNQKYVSQFYNFMHKVNPKPTGLVATPTMFFRPYGFDHYPQLMSFVPANKKTLFLLHKKYPISTIVIPEKDLGHTISRADINAIGLHQTKTIKFWNENYYIFQ